jgi:peptide methionine sulfoxide reductase MsrB
LFSSRDKEDGGVGWPCFTKPLVLENVSGKYENGAEVRSSYHYGNLYLGHIYSDSSKPAHLRYCIDSGNLLFIPRQELQNDKIFTGDKN